jgi:hypothetical protein
MDPRRVILYTGIAAAVGTAMLTVPAWAEGGTSVGGLSLFDATDSHGIKISQYELSMDRGGLTDQTRAVLTMLLAFLWDTYRWWIGFLAYILDWTIGMTWVTWITGPINDAAIKLREAVLQPLGATGFDQQGLIALFFLIAGTTGGVAVFRGRAGGWSTMITSACIAALAVGALAAPVVMFAGNDSEPAKPLRYAQRIGVELGNAATTGKLSNAAIDSTTAETEPVAGRILVDTFIRPVHQTLNYGASIDQDQSCVSAYDKALKAGPYGDAAAEGREAVGACDDKYGDYADNPSNSWLFGLETFALAALLLGGVILTFVVLLWFAVICLTWAALQAMFHTVWAIMPGNSRGPLLRDLADIVVSLCYVTTGIALLSVIMEMIKRVLQNNAQVPIFAQFIAVDFMLVAGLVLLITNYVQHRRGSKTLTKKFTDRLKQSVPRPQAGTKTWEWLKQPSPSAGGAGYSLGSDGRGGLVPIINQGPIRRVLNSNGGRLAAAAGGLAAGAATGGATLAAKGTMTAGKVAARGTLAAGRTANHGYQAARTVQRTHGAIRAGAQRATTGRPWVDAALVQANRAHHHLDNKISEAASQATAAPQVYSVTRRGATHATTGNKRLDTTLTRVGHLHNRVNQAGVGALTSAVLSQGPNHDRTTTSAPDRGSWRRQQPGPASSTPLPKTATAAKTSTTAKLSAGRTVARPARRRSQPVATQTPARRPRSPGLPAPAAAMAPPLMEMVEAARQGSRQEGNDDRD